LVTVQPYPYLVKVIDFWSQATWVDYAATAVVVTPYFIITSIVGHGDWLRWISADQRLAVYGTGATIISIFGGLCAVAITIYVTIDGKRAQAIRARHNRDLQRNWRSLFIGLGLSALACLAAQAIDVRHDPLSSRIVFVAAMIFAIWRFARLIWLFDALIGVADQDLSDNGPLPAPKLGPAWAGKKS
jgi:hypothetical protein